MSKLRPKQIEGFEITNVTAFNDGSQIIANETTFPSTAAVQNEFIPERALIVEQFTGLAINSSSTAWNITLNKTVQEDNVDMVTVFINGVKLMDNFTASVSGSVVTMAQLDYDIDAYDIIEVHYVESHIV